MPMATKPHRLLDAPAPWYGAGMHRLDQITLKRFPHLHYPGGATPCGVGGVSRWEL